MRAQTLQAAAAGAPCQRNGGERSASAISPNVLDRQFTADQPNRKWIADFTYVWTAEGWLYVAAVIDLFSRRVVGWSMKAEMSAQLVTDALLMAIWRRGAGCAVASLRQSEDKRRFPGGPALIAMDQPVRLVAARRPVRSDPHSDRPTVSFPGPVDRPGTPRGEALPSRDACDPRRA